MKLEGGRGNKRSSRARTELWVEIDCDRSTSTWTVKQLGADWLVVRKHVGRNRWLADYKPGIKYRFAVQGAGNRLPENHMWVEHKDLLSVTLTPVYASAKTASTKRPFSVARFTPPTQRRIAHFSHLLVGLKISFYFLLKSNSFASLLELSTFRHTLWPCDHLQPHGLVVWCHLDLSLHTQAPRSAVVYHSTQSSHPYSYACQYSRISFLAGFWLVRAF